MTDDRPAPDPSVSKQPGLTIQITQPQQEQVVVEIGGELDLSTAGQIERTIMDLLEHGSRTVQLDLSSVSFLDSSGIRVLVSCHQRAEELGERLVVSQLNYQPLRTLELTGLIELLTGNPT